MLCPHNVTFQRFKPAAQLRTEFEDLLAGRDPATVVHQCGSGVSAVPNLLAMQIAGRAFDEATVYRVAHAYCDAAGWTERHPPIGQAVKEPVMAK